MPKTSRKFPSSEAAASKDNSSKGNPTKARASKPASKRAAEPGVRDPRRTPDTASTTDPVRPDDGRSGKRQGELAHAKPAQGKPIQGKPKPGSEGSAREAATRQAGSAKPARRPARKTFLVAATRPDGGGGRDLRVYACVTRTPGEALAAVRAELGAEVAVELTGKLSNRMARTLELKADEVRQI